MCTSILQQTAGAWLFLPDSAAAWPDVARISFPVASDQKPPTCESLLLAIVSLSCGAYLQNPAASMREPRSAVSDILTSSNIRSIMHVAIYAAAVHKTDQWLSPKLRRFKKSGAAAQEKQVRTPPSELLNEGENSSEESDADSEGDSASSA